MQPGPEEPSDEGERNDAVQLKEEFQAVAKAVRIYEDKAHVWFLDVFLVDGEVKGFEPTNCETQFDTSPFDSQSSTCFLGHGLLRNCYDLAVNKLSHQSKNSKP